MSDYHSDIDTIEVDAYINTRRAQVDPIQTINSDELAALMRVQSHRTAMAIAATPWQRTCGVRFVVVTSSRSTIFTIIGVQKLVSARRLLALDRFT